MSFGRVNFRCDFNLLVMSKLGNRTFFGRCISPTSKIKTATTRQQHPRKKKSMLKKKAILCLAFFSVLVVSFGHYPLGRFISAVTFDIAEPLYI